MSSTAPAVVVIDLSLVLPPLMGEAHLDATSLSERIGLDARTIDQWCTGALWAPESVLAQVALVFGLSAADMLASEPSRRLPPPRAVQRTTNEISEDRLHAAGMTRVHPLIYEMYCLCCGRGTGAGGVLRTTRRLPARPANCRYCQGHMLVREPMYEKDAA